MIRGERRAGGWAAWVAFLALSAGLAAPARSTGFQGLGVLPGDTESIASATSAAGSVVVGWSDLKTGGSPEAFRWTEAGGMVGLGFLPGDTTSRAYDVSDDGSVIVGQSDLHACRWTQASGMVGLGALPGHVYSNAQAVSGDGSVIVGTSYTFDTGLELEAFRWTETGGMVGLGYLPGTSSSDALCVSADGSVVVGLSQSASGSEAFRWTSSGGMMGLGILPGYDGSWANAVSADASVIVGACTSSTGAIEAVRWNEAGGIASLGTLPGQVAATASGVSGDGSTVVGTFSLQGSNSAFIWDEPHGMRDLETVLTDLGLDLDGWELVDARAVSDDGLTVVGSGINPSGQQEAWIARGPFFVPHIESDPQPGLIEAGRLTTLTLVDGGSPPYAWYKDDVPLTDDPPRMMGTNTRTLTFSPVQETDEGVYHVTYDDGAKAPALTPPFYMPVLPEGTLPALGTAGLILLVLALCVVMVVGRRRWLGHDSTLAPDACGDGAGRNKELRHE